MRASPESDERFMREALSLAERQSRAHYPESSVGCVIVRGGKVVAKGVTAVGGRPHGETQALAKAGEQSSRGDRLRIVRAMRAYRTNSAVRNRPGGRGNQASHSRMPRSDRASKVGDRNPETRRNRSHHQSPGRRSEAPERGLHHRITLGRPRGILKLAMSLDGRIAPAKTNSRSRWISSPRRGNWCIDGVPNGDAVIVAPAL